MAGTDTDVLIVGAGPTGLMLANQLARRGLRPLIIDRHAGPSLQTRALGVQARTLEIYAQLGIAERALELGKRGTGANIWADGQRMARVPLGETGRGVTPYPYILILGQDDNERIMGEKLRSLGGDVQWNTELTGLKPAPDHVVATLKQPDGSSREVSAAWVAGCDGARSAVRELNEIGFPGAPYEHAFFVADAEVTGSMVPDELNVYLRRKGFHLFFPMRGQDHWRIVGILPDALNSRKDVSFDDLRPFLLEEADTGLSLRACTWFSVYRIHHRAATRFRADRCFLLGDAAHIHSPVGAQGMNTGLQDAYNLAWKLALVVKGQADARLLDSYEAERVPIARRLLETTDRAFMLVVNDSWLISLLRTKVLARVAAFAMGLETVRRLAFRVVSQTGIHYRGSPLSESDGSLPGYAPRAGERFPWLQLKMQAGGPVEDLFRKCDDLRFHLLLFGQHTSGSHKDFQIHAIPEDPHNEAELDRAGVPATSFFLLRPDGHVALCGARLKPGAIERYLSERLGIKN